MFAGFFHLRFYPNYQEADKKLRDTKPRMEISLATLFC